MNEGDRIQALCYNSAKKTNEWLDGTFECNVAALDREYRVKLTLDDGRQIREAAPECVSILNKNASE